MLVIVLLFVVASLTSIVLVQALRAKSSSRKSRLTREPYAKPQSQRVGYLESTSVVSKAGCTPEISTKKDDSDTILGLNRKVDSCGGAVATTEANIPATPIDNKPLPEKDALIVLHLNAAENRQYAGYELLQSILAVGFRYGKMNIFHRYEKKTNKGPVLFSLASCEPPGTFDLPKMGGFSTKGLSLFLNLNTVPEPMATFELMLHAAGQLTDDLGGKVVDAERNLLTKEKVREICLTIRRLEHSLGNMDLFESAEIDT